MQEQSRLYNGCSAVCEAVEEGLIMTRIAVHQAEKSRRSRSHQTGNITVTCSFGLCRYKSLACQ